MVMAKFKSGGSRCRDVHEHPLQGEFFTVRFQIEETRWKDVKISRLDFMTAKLKSGSKCSPSVRFKIREPGVRK